jgi:hypothetical protein
MRPRVGASGLGEVRRQLQPGQSGVRSFCGDSRGVICQTPHGTPPTVVGGVCEPCDPIR